MLKMELKNHRRWPAGKISQCILYLLAGISLLVFVLFWMIGFGRPYIDNPDFNDPLFTNVLIVLIWLLLLGTVGVTVWSVVSALKKRGKALRTVNNIPVKRLSYSVIVGTVVLLLLTFLLGSGEAMKINGTLFADFWWLKVSDMFICTSLLMIIVASGCVVYGSLRSKYSRKRRRAMANESANNDKLKAS